jgi:hypothetical protein
MTKNKASNDDQPHSKPLFYYKKGITPSNTIKSNSMFQNVVRIVVPIENFGVKFT